MVVLGYRSGANFAKAPAVIVKHTSMNITEARKICKKIEDGEGVTLPDDFVLREDLEDLDFLIS